MLRCLFIGILILSVFCMVPLMWAGNADGGHIHHGASASCGTCMGPESFLGELFLLTVIGIALLMIPASPPLPAIRRQFPPPRIA